MKVGVIFPTRELPPRPEAIRSWAQGVEAAGAHHIAFPDHILGIVHEDQEPGWDRDWPHPSGRGVYGPQTRFHEAFVTMGFIAGGCKSIELVSGILVLPMRNTALVAKQAAQLDLLNGGRFRLGVAAGWNAAEFASVGAEYRGRGRRLVEQVELLRRFWTEDSVHFHGEFHDVVGACLSPGPVQRPIPIWMGGGSFDDGRGLEPIERVLERIGRLSDGWYLDTLQPPSDLAQRAIDRVRRAAADADRDPDALGFDVRILLRNVPEHKVAETVAGWAQMGVTHVTIDTSDVGNENVAEYIHCFERVIRSVRDRVGDQ